VDQVVVPLAKLSCNNSLVVWVRLEELQLTGCAGVDEQGNTQLARPGSGRGTWREKAVLHGAKAGRGLELPLWRACSGIAPPSSRLPDPPTINLGG
jgi:hypothetical protein